MSTIIHYPKRPKGPTITCFADVKRLAPRMGLTDNTMAMLVERGFGSVQGLRGMKESDIEGLPLYTGQQLAISKVITHLNEVLSGYDINDATVKEEDEEESVKNRDVVTLDEDEKVKVVKGGDGTKAGILNMDGYQSGKAGAPRTVPRPHEFLVGKTNGKELNMEEFLYGNLLILEYMMEQDSPEVRAVLKHLRFMVLKLVHGYPVEQIIFYDYALRTKIERDQMLMPLDADQELLDKYKTYKEDKKKKKGAKGAKGKGKKKAKKDEDEVIGY